MLCIASVFCLVLEHSVPDSNVEPHLDSSAIEEAEKTAESWNEKLFFQAAAYSESVIFDYDRWGTALKFDSESSPRFSIGTTLSGDKKGSAHRSAVLEFGSNSLSNRARYSDLTEQNLTMGTRHLEYDTVGTLFYYRVDEPRTSSLSVVGGVGWIWMRDSLTLDDEITPNEGTKFQRKSNEFVFKYGLKYDFVCTDDLSLFVEYRREVLPFGDVNWDSEGILLGFTLDL